MSQQPEVDPGPLELEPPSIEKDVTARLTFGCLGLIIVGLSIYALFLMWRDGPLLIPAAIAFLVAAYFVGGWVIDLMGKI